jgi:hypothetical protein
MRRGRPITGCDGKNEGEAAVVDLHRAAQEWQTHGFVILPGFVPVTELKPALDGLPAMYPTGDGFHDGSAERRDRFTVDEWAGISSFPFLSTEPNPIKLIVIIDKHERVRERGRTASQPADRLERGPRQAIPP